MSAENPALEIAIVVEQMHPRVVYALETVMEEFLGLRMRLLVADEIPTNVVETHLPTFNYCRKPSDVYPNLPCNGLLYEDIIRQASEEIDWMGKVSSQLGTEDHVAQIFYTITQYELLRPLHRMALDDHGRNPDTKGPLTVHAWLDGIVQMLNPWLPKPIARRSFDFEITIDVDQPWKYLHKPWHVRWGGLIKSLMDPMGDARLRWKVMQGQLPDPFEVLELVREMCPAQKTKVFFLVGGRHPNDSRFDIKMKPYQRLVQAWQAAGFEIGVHPSYLTATDAEQMRCEKEGLEAVIGPIHISRQHYLRYKTPETFRQLIDLGIQRDYTLCRSTLPGPPTGVALPYRWFDLQRNTATDLVLVPAMVMDRSLQLYQGMQPYEAQKAIRKAILQTKAVGGKFVVILHNETFSEAGEWKGWRAVIQDMIQHLQS